MNLPQFSPARVAAILAGASSLLAGLAPAIANMDTKSTAGVVAGILGVVTAYGVWAQGRRAHEARTADVTVPWPVDPEPSPEPAPAPAAEAKPTRKRVGRAKPKKTDEDGAA